MEDRNDENFEYDKRESFQPDESNEWDDEFSEFDEEF